MSHSSHQQAYRDLERFELPGDAVSENVEQLASRSQADYVVPIHCEAEAVITVPAACRTGQDVANRI